MRSFFCLMLALALLLPAALMAQIVTVTDRTCERLTCPPTVISVTSCTSQTFTVPRTDTYWVDSWTACPLSTQCYGCMACVSIYGMLSSQPILVCDTHDCIEHLCRNNCSVQLRQGEQYTIQVCLEPCPNARDCGQCANDCYAGGCVRTADTRPCYPNP